MVSCKNTFPRWLQNLTVSRHFHVLHALPCRPPLFDLLSSEEPLQFVESVVCPAMGLLIGAFVSGVEARSIILTTIGTNMLPYGPLRALLNMAPKIECINQPCANQLPTSGSTRNKDHNKTIRYACCQSKKIVPLVSCVCATNDHAMNFRSIHISRPASASNVFG